jgi:hypothetical protein
MIVIAQLGGYLNRTCDRIPGFECLWRGYVLFDAKVQMMQLYHASISKTRQPMRRAIFVGQAQG